LDFCPDCGCKQLSACPSTTEEHIQEDIIPAHVEVTKFVHHGYWCPCCGEVKVAGYVPDEVPYGYLGPNVLILIIRMKYHQGLSYEKIEKFLEGFCGLKVTQSGMAQALQRISRWLKVEEDIVLAAIRASPYNHIDETGWKIAGRGHWLWDFVNQCVALYRIRQSRGRKVLVEILGENYDGDVVSDFLSAYNKIGKHRQRCLVHLDREMHRVKELDCSLESLNSYRRLRRIVQDARRLDERRKTLNSVVFIRRLRKLEKRLFDFATGVFARKHWQRLSARMLKHYDEILTFLKVPGLPSHNNHAERMIRPNVIFRKISFQNMSQRGARAHEVLMSLQETLRLQKLDPSDFFKRAYLSHRQGRPEQMLQLGTA
jgi:transposase